MRIYYRDWLKHLEIMVQTRKGVSHKLPQKKKRKMVKLEILLPKRFFFKGELVCETIEKATNKTFNISNLIELNVEETLQSYYRKKANPAEMYSAFKTVASKPVIKRYYEDHSNELMPVKIQLPESMILKLKIMLAAMDELEGNRLFTVEEVVEYHYLLYIDGLLKDNNNNSIHKIISHLTKKKKQKKSLFI